ncbi:PLP-dependent transferase [Eremomyces bilateralis CBS 781.70]|uniref:PLP-dependent transferase n=1 Tax=Eremomyces bilateralis CBS 781.70 TaxID=1392243 RepID=A0A6G1GFK9_9PEZI|nr:PLP-dependent transferase [Eremomyces bilateralis CBS 781.70]KAF1816858.1 PLP-dependent transferase [Eremomyces bilateralis CBS 781.70]
MVQLEPFQIEDWMDEWENKCEYNIAETCCSSISLNELQDLSENKTGLEIDRNQKLTYGAIRGSSPLRSNLAKLYSSKVSTPLPEDNILITNGAIAANHLVFYSLIGPGDHVVCHYPTYQQLYSVPASLGAEVDLWKAKAEAKWIPDIEDLKGLIKKNTKLLVLNNPNNPTGAVLPRSLLQQVIDLAQEHNLIILSDEVYRPAFHSIGPMDPEFPRSILSMGYDNAIATGSMSKAYALAGIRVGWIASRSRELVEKIAGTRHYTTISVSQLDEQVAAFALSYDTVHHLLSRNIQLAKTNLAILERFVIKFDDECEWVKPVAGTTAFVRFHREGKAVDSEKLCEAILEKAGVLFAPGRRCFGDEFPGYVRIGFVADTETLEKGLARLKVFMKKEFDEVPLAN